MDRSREEVIQEILDDLPFWRRTVDPTALAPAGIPSVQGLVLSVVHRRKRLSIKEIASEMHVTASAATQLVDALVTSGLLSRQADAEDRRRQLVAVTADGRARLADIRKAHAANLDRLLSPLSIAELAVFRDLLRKVSGHSAPAGGEELSHR